MGALSLQEGVCWFLGCPKLSLFMYQTQQKHTYSVAAMSKFHMGQLGAVCSGEWEGRTMAQRWRAPLRSPRAWAAPSGGPSRPALASSPPLQGFVTQAW